MLRIAMAWNTEHGVAGEEDYGLVVGHGLGHGTMIGFTLIWWWYLDPHLGCIPGHMAWAVTDRHAPRFGLTEIQVLSHRVMAGLRTVMQAMNQCHSHIEYSVFTH